MSGVRQAYHERAKRLRAQSLNYRWKLTLVSGSETIKLRAIEVREAAVYKDLVPMLRRLVGDRLQAKT